MLVFTLIVGVAIGMLFGMEIADSLNARATPQEEKQDE